MNATIPTARALRHSLEARGVTGPAQDLMVRLTAESRHRARVQAVLDLAGATDAGILRDPRESGHPPATVEAVVFWAFLDVVGVGGPQGLGGDGTDRHPVFAALGAASKHSAPGAAWTAAIVEARNVLLGAAWVTLVVRATRLDGAGEVLVEVQRPGAAFVQVWSTEVLSGDEWVPEAPTPADAGSSRGSRRWLAALAGIAVARLAGVAPGLREAEISSVEFDGDISLWSEVYARCVDVEARDSSRERLREPADGVTPQIGSVVAMGGAVGGAAVVVDHAPDGTARLVYEREDGALLAGDAARGWDRADEDEVALYRAAEPWNA